MALAIKEREQVGPGAFADQNPELSWPQTLPLPPHPTLSVRGVIYSLLHLGTAQARAPHMLQPRSASTATTGTGGKEQGFADGVGSWAVPAPRPGSPRFPRADPRVCSQPDRAALRREASGGAQRLNNVNKKANEESPAQLAVFWLTWMGVPYCGRWVCGAGDIATPPPSAL